MTTWAGSMSCITHPAGFVPGGSAKLRICGSPPGSLTCIATYGGGLAAAS